MGYVTQLAAQNTAAPRPLFPLSPAQVRATLARAVANEAQDAQDGGQP